MSLLISFCNQATSPHLSLLLLDQKDPSKNQWVNLPNRAYRHFGGMTGITKDQNYIYAVAQIPNGNTELLIFDLNLILKAIHPLLNVRDGHSICLKENKLYIASTGTDQVFQITISEDLRTLKEEVFWTSPDFDPQKPDNTHLNSMSLINNQLHISAFGKRESDSWTSAKNGYCLNIESSEYIVSGIFHPHSLNQFADQYFICESQTGNLLIADAGSNEIKHMIELGGYIRGIGFDGEYYYIGRSADRKTSRSSGKKINQSGKIKTAALLKLNKNFELISEISLEGLGSEIYGVFYLPNLEPNPQDTIKLRVAQLERRIKDISRMYSELLLERS